MNSFCLIGSDLAGAKYAQPITGISLPFLPGSHVNVEQGTGLVHTAPAHGKDDFLVALDNKISVVSFDILIKLCTQFCLRWIHSRI